MRNNYLILVLFISILFGCNAEYPSSKNNELKNPPASMFTKIEPEHSHIQFSNNILEDLKFNFLSYNYVYLGGGVSTGDINNDGLIDLYFTSNQNSNKLYINKGDFVFEDITNKANVDDKTGWSTGVTMVDINNDGWLDIYVCKSASLENQNERRNKLFINQKDNTFKEEAAKWNINDSGFSIQSYFFDMDKDGDLDMYLVNHRVDFKNNGQINSELQRQITSETSDQLYRNDDGRYTNISQKAGILNKAWGLSASIGDFNNDDWPDVYVCNDFVEPDMLYINNKDNTFSNTILEEMRHISFNSMGSDYADINNDLLPDLTVLDMTPSDHVRSKSNMGSMSTEDFNAIVDVGYHHAYMVNMLQLNNGNSTFSEIGQMAHISKSDWSWAPLLADFDNDGFKDLFITNGTYKDLTNNDARATLKAITARGEKLTLDSALKIVPNQKLSNYMFHNGQNLKFDNKSKEWGLDKPSFSNGAAYADLDNDGDLDLIVNNISDKAFLYKNNSTNNYIAVNLKGSEKNPLGIGAKAVLYTSNGNQLQEMYLSRGFQSSVHNRLNFGLGNLTHADSITVTWPNGMVCREINVQTNQTITMDYKNATKYTPLPLNGNQFVQKIEPSSIGIDFVHKENEFDDFKDQILLPYSQSHNGPFIDKGDINGDGLEDFYIGGAAGQSGALFIQKSDETFKKVVTPFLADKKYEDLGVLFFDYDGDGDNDLYVVSGGSEFPEGSEMFQDRIYKNEGNDTFTKTNNVLPEIRQSGQVVVNDDVDGDGDQDLFIGGRLIPDKYPYAPESYFLINNDGKFVKNKVTDENVGMVTDAVFTDYDGDGDNDLMVVGEWSELIILDNNNGVFNHAEIESLKNTRGIWFSIAKNDIDKDGDDDFIIGNLGKNAKYDTENGKEFHIYCDDFDSNGTYDIVLSNKYKGNLVPARGRECSSEQVPGIKEKFPNYELFANATLNDIFGDEELNNALHYQANTLYNVFVENLGNGEFKITNLPMHSQLSPINSSQFIDLDKDGVAEILSVGNIFNAEVETVRYDASFGSILSHVNGSFNVIDNAKTGFYTSGDSKSIVVLNNKYIIVANNNDSLEVFKIL